MTRQYYCWKVCLTYRCGCKEYTDTEHRCGHDREGCNNWMTLKETDRYCEKHRAKEWGLSSSSTLSPTSESSSSPEPSPAFDPADAQSAAGPPLAGSRYNSYGSECSSTSGGSESGRVGGRVVKEVGKGEGVWEGCFARRRV